METTFDKPAQAGKDDVPLLLPLRQIRGEIDKTGDEHAWPRLGRSPFVRSRVQSIGIWNTVLLSAGFLVSAAVSLFLGFLWLSSPNCDPSHRFCGLWRNIVLSNNVLSTAITISATVLRRALALQTGVALSMVAALALESAAGVPLLGYIWSTFRSMPLYNVCALAVIWKTLASRITSTLLVSNLGPGYVVGNPIKADRYIGKDAEGLTDFLRRLFDHTPQYWFGGGQVAYPLFAESARFPAPENNIWKRDTSPTLRAFPPVLAFDEKRVLESFLGYSAIWDTTFSCFEKSPFQYLIINTTGDWIHWSMGLKSESSLKKAEDGLNWELVEEWPWTTATTPITYNLPPEMNDPSPFTATIGISMSYCVTPFASTVVPVSMRRGRNRAEPVTEPTYGNRTQDSVNLNEIARLYAGAWSGEAHFSRGVFKLERIPMTGPFKWDAPDELQLITYELSSLVIQEIHEGALVAINGLNPSTSLCDQCHLDASTTFRAHRDHLAVSQHILRSTGSLPLTMQTVWTILAQIAYYDRLPEFNVQRESSIASFSQVLVPGGVSGLVFVVIVIVGQNLAVALIMSLFIRRTRLSGNLWQGLGQLVASDIGEVASRTTVATDEEVLAHLLGNGELGGTSVSLVCDVQEKVSRVRQMDRDQPSSELQTLNKA
ncbi:hypothetical protein B0H63DRAFT_540856 [Podospora didyma]|uniref:Uncharacterized protein n=1 Tax=Podospora didyma TaxID=330526 RepID=A0AAE0U160_9PEZI|nr:hypothetical protein B0H63DRAFT_540856 [Podospora didyma]